MPSNGFRRQVMKYRYARRRNGRGGQMRMFLAGGLHLAELAGGLFKLSTEYADVSRRVERQRHSIPGNPANLEHNVISHVNPFTNFSTKHQHR
jgi:hypothetical protein